MRKTAIAFSVIILAGLVFESGGRAPQDAKKETVLDRVTHLEQDLHLSVPQVPRLCDRLDLKKRRIKVGDCELYVEEEGKGVPIVLLHGGPGATHHYFHPFFSRAKDFARVIYYDQRGCGISGWCPGAGYTVGQAVEDLENLRKALNIEKWVVVGHSYGGLLAHAYSLKHPGSLSGLVLIGASEGMHVPMKPTRQYDFFSDEEKAKKRQIRAELGRLIKEGKLPQEKYVGVLVYNNFLNGDWKRQNFFKPTPERFAQIALYEWKQDTDFNSVMSQDADRFDLQGAFEGFPVPTLIMEGEWDLTWNTDKREILHRNRPGSRLMLFSHSSHSPFEDEPEQFFPALRDFLAGLPAVPAARVSAWKEYLAGWKVRQEASFSYVLRSAGYGRKSNERISSMYTAEVLKELEEPDAILKAGFALYDVARYEEALALIWQGFILDLFGRRNEAIAVYKAVVDLKVNGEMTHDQFGLTIAPSPYAAERMKTPFQRVENKLKD
jgi:proline iminopeptidase